MSNDLNDLYAANSNQAERQKVAIVGATGMVGRRLAALLIDHPTFEVAMVVGSDGRAGRAYRDVWEAKERALREHYGNFWREYSWPDALRDMPVCALEDLLKSDISVVFSSIPERAGDSEEALLRDGRKVFSNSPYRRFDSDVALVVPEVNGTELGATLLTKNPNCVTSGLILVLAPLHSRYGLREVVVTTYQSLSGRGDAKYATDLVVGNILPLHGSSELTETLIWKEVKKVLGDAFPVSVTCNRTCVQEGHYVEVRVKTNRPVDGVDEVASLFRAFNPLASFKLPTNPVSPIVVLREKGRPRPMQDANHHCGMAVAVGNISTDDEVFDLRLAYVVNNLQRGAAGGVLLNAEVWNAQNVARTQEGRITVTVATSKMES